MEEGHGPTATEPPIWRSSVWLERHLEDTPRFPGDAVYAPGDGSPRGWAPVPLDGAAEPLPSDGSSADREKWYKRKWRDEWAISRGLQQRVETLQAELAEAQGQVHSLREETQKQSATHYREVRRASTSAIALKEAEAETRRVGTERDHWQERGERAEQAEQAALKEVRGGGSVVEVAWWR